MFMGSQHKALEEIESGMHEATSYDQWLKLAVKHDQQTGMLGWRKRMATSLYDYNEINHRQKKLYQIKERKDYRALLFNLNEGIHGNMGGMGKPVLYSKAKSGTKVLVNEYISEIVESIDLLASDACDEISDVEKLEFFKRASLCFGKSALMLSGAGTLGLFHLGVVKALFETNLLPDVISGSSAGAMIAGAIGTRRADRVSELFDSKHVAVERDIQRNLFDWLFSGREGRLDSAYVETMINSFVEDLTFQEAYELTGKAINISVSPTEQHQSSRLMNAITSPNVLVRSAVYASCAVPGVLPPVTLEAKSMDGMVVPYLPSRKWQDGSMSMDLPIKRLSRIYSINHTIVSQTNPVLLWALSDPKTERRLVDFGKRLMLSASKESLHASAQVLKKRFRRFPKVRFLAAQIEGLSAQQYTGDVNIFPGFRMFDPRKFGKRWDVKEVEYLIREGELATWPKIEMIGNCVRVGNKLRQAIDKIECKMANLEGGSVVRKLKSAKG
jgi:predicted acylesterase/phospholipase RssA